MFFKLAFLCSVAACVLAAPSPTNVVPLEKEQPTVIPIVSQSEELEANGTYKYSYETANGIKREETSYDKILPKAEGRSAGSGDGSDGDESNEIHVQQGSYSYVAPDGTVISVRYIADENGFRPVGDHLPKAPVLVQQAQANANGKQGRALNTDNTESGSEAVAAKAVDAIDAAPASSENKPKETAKDESSAVKVADRSGSDSQEQTSTAASGELPSTASPTTELVKNEASQSTTSVASDASTTKAVVVSEAVSTTETASATDSQSNTESALTTESASTTESVSTTESPSSTESASTTEALNTTKVPAAEASEASTLAPTAEQQTSTEAASSSSDISTSSSTATA